MRLENLSRILRKKDIFYTVQNNDQISFINVQKASNTRTENVPAWGHKLCSVPSITEIIKSRIWRAFHLVSRGLCKGTSLVIAGLFGDYNEAKVLSSTKGDRMFIPPTDLAPNYVNLPSLLQSQQFLLIPDCFKTNCKSQWQTLHEVGVGLSTVSVQCIEDSSGRNVLSV